MVVMRRPAIHHSLVPDARLAARYGPVLPELNVAVLAQRAALDQAATLAHQLLSRDAGLAEQTQVVGDDVAVAAAGTRDQHRPVVIALLGDGVLRARTAGHAGEG